jgi:hypothetical protein
MRPVTVQLQTCGEEAGPAQPTFSNWHLKVGVEVALIGRLRPTKELE